MYDNRNPLSSMEHRLSHPLVGVCKPVLGYKINLLKIWNIANKLTSSTSAVSLGNEFQLLIYDKGHLVLTTKFRGHKSGHRST